MLYIVSLLCLVFFLFLRKNRRFSDTYPIMQRGIWTPVCFAIVFIFFVAYQVAAIAEYKATGILRVFSMLAGVLLASRITARFSPSKALLMLAGMCNSSVMIANNWHMPIDSAQFFRLKTDHPNAMPSIDYVLTDNSTKLDWLCDRIYTFSVFPGGIASVGDVLLWSGLIILALHTKILFFRFRQRRA